MSANNSANNNRNNNFRKNYPRQPLPPPPSVAPQVPSPEMQQMQFQLQQMQHQLYQMQQMPQQVPQVPAPQAAAARESFPEVFTKNFIAKHTGCAKHNRFPQQMPFCFMTYNAKSHNRHYRIELNEAVYITPEQAVAINTILNRQVFDLTQFQAPQVPVPQAQPQLPQQPQPQ